MKTHDVCALLPVSAAQVSPAGQGKLSLTARARTVARTVESRLIALFDAVLDAQARRASRQALARLDERMLADIGLSPGAVDHRSAKKTDA